MKIPEQGELWYPKPGELKDQALEDFRSALELGGFEVPELTGTVDEFRFAAVDAMLQPVFYNQAVRVDASDERYAQGSDLDDIMARLQIPQIVPSPSEGNAIVSVAGIGSVTIPVGLEGKLSTGQFVRAKATTFGVFHGHSVTLQSVNTGTSANAKGGTKGKWISPPLNLATEFVIDENGMVNGGDSDTDDSKRERIRIERISRPKPDAENWGALVQVAREAHASIKAAYVYPAIGGPSSAKVVIVNKRNLALGEYTRVCPDEVVEKVRNAIRARFFSMSEILVQTVQEEEFFLGVKLTFTNNRNNWLGASWPIPTSVAGHVALSQVENSKRVRILHGDLFGSSPSDNRLHISWFHAPSGSIVSTKAMFDGISGTEAIIDTEAPLVASGQTIQVGDIIFPTPVGVASYIDQIDRYCYNMGPGENVASVPPLNENANRGFRLPRPFDMHPYSLSDIGSFFRSRFPEVSLFQYTTDYNDLDVPATANDKPIIRRLKSIGLYPVY